MMSGFRKAFNFKSKENSKTSKEKPKQIIRMVACNKCHSTTNTLIKAKDSYYCKDCFIKLKKEKY